MSGGVALDDAQGQASPWIILQCAPSRTLNLAASLEEDGFRAWTPSRRETIRRVRWNARRAVRLPLLAGYLFAGSEHLFELLELAAMPVKPRRGAGLRKPAHAAFSLFRDPLYQGGIHAIDDHVLTTLREAEIPAKMRRKQSAYGHDAPVRIISGSFEGLSARVERSDRKSATVWVTLFGRHHRVDLPTSILRLDDAYSLQSETDPAQKAA